MNNLISNFTKDQQKKAMINFLDRKTNHSTNNSTIRKGIKSDWSVTLENGSKVNFWFDEEMMFYGVIGYGIFSGVPVDKLLEDEASEQVITKGNLNDFVSFTKKNGGCTFNINTSEINPNRGYSVAIAGRELKVAKAIFTKDNLVNFIHDNLDLLTNDKYFLGGWIDKNYLYLDVVEIIEDLRDAIDFGMDNDQLAIFDCKESKEIRLPKRQKSGTNTQNSTYNKIAAIRLIEILSK